MMNMKISQELGLTEIWFKLTHFVFPVHPDHIPSQFKMHRYHPIAVALWNSMF